MASASPPDTAGGRCGWKLQRAAAPWPPASDLPSSSPPAGHISIARRRVLAPGRGSARLEWRRRAFSFFMGIDTFVVCTPALSVDIRSTPRAHLHVLPPLSSCVQPQNVSLLSATARSQQYARSRIVSSLRIFYGRDRLTNSSTSYGTHLCCSLWRLHSLCSRSELCRHQMKKHRLPEGPSQHLPTRHRP